MNEKYITEEVVRYITDFVQTHTKSPFEENKDANLRIHEFILKNKTGMWNFLTKIIHPFGNSLCFSTYNMDFDGIAHIENVSKDKIKIYSQKLFNNDKEQSILFAPEKMHFIQENSDKFRTTGAIKTKKQGSGLEVLSSGKFSDELSIDGGHVIMIYPYCSNYADPKEKIKIMRDHFRLKLDEANLIQIPSAFYDSEAFLKNNHEEELNSSMKKN